MLYCESNCDLYSVRGREAHGNTGAAPRAAPLQAGIMITAVRSVTSGCTTFLQNGLDVPSSKRSELTHTPPAFQNNILCIQITVVAPEWQEGSAREGSTRGVDGSAPGVHQNF
jgi:hypothetical protein